MVSCPLVAGGLLAAVALGLGSAAVSQDRSAQRGRLIERMMQRRSQPSDPNPTRITAAGTFRFHFTYDGLRRDYLVHVPAAAIGKAAPMLLALHGGGGDMDYQAQNYGLIEKSDSAGFIAVFPNGASRFPGGILATWNAGNCCGDARDHGVDDVGFLKAVIGRVATQAGADRTRVFVTGMSNGAMMAYRLACDAPGLVRGIAPVAGTDNTNACTPSRPVAVIHFHARNDDHVLFEGGAGAEAFRDRSKVSDFTSVPATIAKWVALDHAHPKARNVLTVPGARCDSHAAAKGGAPVELCVTETGGHSWPGSTTARANKAPASQAISANDLMWSFFSSL